MGYKVLFEPESKCICVTVNGELSLQILQSIASEVSVLIKATGCKCILNDLRNATMATPSTTYNMPETAVKAGVNRATKRALLVKNTDDFHFLETVFVNRGNIVKLFESIDKAKSWLLEGIEPGTVS